MTERRMPERGIPERAPLPVVPLRDTVLFPGVATPITAGRRFTLRAIEAALRDVADDKYVFAVAQRDGADEPTREGLYAIGVIARVTHVQRLDSGLRLVLSCKDRAAALRYTEQDGVILAATTALPDVHMRLGEERSLQPLAREVRDRAIEYGRLHGAPEDILRQFIGTIQDPCALVNHVAFYLDLATAAKQSLLETLSTEQRLRELAEHLARHLGVARVDEHIRASVHEEIGERQRELYLREQLKVIQRELGEDDEASFIERLEARVAEAAPPPEVMLEVKRDVARLKRMGRENSPEAQVLTGWLEWVADLPWQRRTEDHLSIAEARRILDADHHGLPDVKDRVLELLSVRKLRERRDGRDGRDGERARATSRGPILLFLGPPGTGKTSIAEAIASAIGRKMVRVSLGGARDEADIRGHRRTYVGAMPGRIIAAVKRAGTRNPVVVLDEIDKLGSSYQGDPGAALLDVLDPAQNGAFVDHYLGVPFDLSEVLFICTANLREGIPAALFDRMDPVQFPGYTELEKLEIARRYLVPRQREGHALGEASLVFSDEALRVLIARYTREAGVRALERAIAAVARKAARRIVEGEIDACRVERASDLQALLGRPHVHPTLRLSRDEPGVATGMYYTAAGGDIMHVEASVMPGRGDLALTGQLGEVMKESGRAALTYARMNGARLGIPEGRMRGRDFHVHVPAGAIPKDGPSAGVTIAVALVSALSGRAIRAGLAMTGEITLRGRVLGVGGVKEKVLGASRAGMTEVLLPRENEADLDVIAPEVQQALTFHFVETLDEALDVALRPAAGLAQVA
jgi:ATP-dependent Lon protease